MLSGRNGITAGGEDDGDGVNGNEATSERPFNTIEMSGRGRGLGPGQERGVGGSPQPALQQRVMTSALEAAIETGSIRNPPTVGRGSHREDIPRPRLALGQRAEAASPAEWAAAETAPETKKSVGHNQEEARSRFHTHQSRRPYHHQPTNKKRMNAFDGDDLNLLKGEDRSEEEKKETQRSSDDNEEGLDKHTTPWMEDSTNDSSSDDDQEHELCVTHKSANKKKKRKEFTATGGYAITNDLEDTDEEALTMTACANGASLARRVKIGQSSTSTYPKEVRTTEEQNNKKKKSEPIVTNETSPPTAPTDPRTPPSCRSRGTTTPTTRCWDCSHRRCTAAVGTVVASAGTPPPSRTRSARASSRWRCTAYRGTGTTGRGARGGGGRGPRRTRCG